MDVITAAGDIPNESDLLPELAKARAEAAKAKEEANAAALLVTEAQKAIDTASAERDAAKAALADAVKERDLLAAEISRAKTSIEELTKAAAAAEEAKAKAEQHVLDFDRKVAAEVARLSIGTARLPAQKGGDEKKTWTQRALEAAGVSTIEELRALKAKRNI